MSLVSRIVLAPELIYDEGGTPGPSSREILDFSWHTVMWRRPGTEHSRVCRLMEFQRWAYRTKAMPRPKPAPPPPQPSTRAPAARRAKVRNAT